jgi:hypothetical protein
MYEITEVVAEYTTEAEAEVALTRLREEGLEGEVAGIGGELVPVAPFRLLVVAENAARARQILGLHTPEQYEQDWEEAAEAAIDGWLCAFCDTEVSLTEAFCPECGASRGASHVDDDEKKG